MDYNSVASYLNGPGWLQTAPAGVPAPAPRMPAGTPWDVREGIASTKHTIDRSFGEWNEVHPYKRATRGTDGPMDIGVGQFLNSEGNESLYAGGIFRNGPLFAELGAATGYSGAPVVPFGRAGINLSDIARMFVAPSYNPVTGQMGPVFGAEMDFVRF